MTFLSCPKCHRAVMPDADGEVRTPGGGLHVCATLVATGGGTRPSTEPGGKSMGVVTAGPNQPAPRLRSDPSYADRPATRSTRLVPPSVTLTNEEKRIWSTLPLGRSSAVPTRVAANNAGIAYDAFRALVEGMRKKGVPICSTVHAPEGIWYPLEYSEALGTYRELRRRFLTQAWNARQVRLGAERMFAQQQSIW